MIWHDGAYGCLDIWMDGIVEGEHVVQSIVGMSKKKLWQEAEDEAKTSVA